MEAGWFAVVRRVRRVQCHSHAFACLPAAYGLECSTGKPSMKVSSAPQLWPAIR